MMSGIHAAQAAVAGQKGERHQQTNAVTAVSFPGRLTGITTGLLLGGAALSRGASGFVSPLSGRPSPELVRPSVGPAANILRTVVPAPSSASLQASERQQPVPGYQGSAPSGLMRAAPLFADLGFAELGRSDEGGMDGVANQTVTPLARGAEQPPVGARKPAIVRVETLAAFKKEVADEKSRMVAVKFFSPTCRACKAMSQSFKALAAKYPDIKFVEVPLTQDNAVLHQGLGVPSVPFGHLYHPEAGLVEEGSINRKRIGDFEHKLQTYLSGSCALPDDD